MTARADAAGYRIRKFVRRNRLAVALTSVAVLALLVTTSMALWQKHQAQVARQKSDLQAHHAERQAEFLTLLMATMSNQSAASEQMLDGGARLLDARYTDDARFRFSALLELAKRYSDLGLSNKQAQVLAKAGAIANAQGDALLLARYDCTLSLVCRPIWAMADARRRWPALAPRCWPGNRMSSPRFARSVSREATGALGELAPSLL